MFSTMWLLAVLGSLVLFSPETRAADAVCTDPSYSSYTNTLGQDPCKVASNLINACPDSSGTPIQALQEGYYYSGLNTVNECGCNTVYYSELYVCAFCQGGSIEFWGPWSANCTETFTTYPRTLPANTNVQSWAYLPLTSNGTLDNDAILADYNTGEKGYQEAVGPVSTQSSVGPSSTTPSFPSPSTSSSQSTTSTTSSANPSASGGTGQNNGGSSDSSSTNVGAIAGGVVGGVVALIAAILAIFFCRRRKRQVNNSGIVVGPDSSNEKPAYDSSSYVPPVVSPYYSGAPQTHEPSSPYSQGVPSMTSDPRASSYYSQSAVPAPGTYDNRPVSQAFSSVPGSPGYAVPEVSQPHDYGGGGNEYGSKFTTVYNPAPPVSDGQVYRYSTTAGGKLS